MVSMTVRDIQPPLRTLYALYIEPLCQKYGITRTEFDILLFLANNPKFDTAAKISNIRYLAKSHVSTSLKSLEKSGYIVKSSEESDKRRIHLCLTEKANVIVAEGRKKQYDFTNIVMDGFNAEEKSLIHSYILRMKSNIETYLEEHMQ